MLQSLPPTGMIRPHFLELAQYIDLFGFIFAIFKINLLLLLIVCQPYARYSLF